MSQQSPLEPGTEAPDFKLKVTPDQQVTLKDFDGQPVILVFYPADFSPVCGDELALYNEVLPEFQKHGAQVIGISVDNVWCHLAFGEERNLHFPLLSDFHPKGEVSRSYNAYLEDEGESARAIYVIDKGGNIAWGYIAPIGVNPGADGALRALEALSDGHDAQSNKS
ncbi:MAG: Alkyl hydroperoxide reductase subunit C-like protein [Candidatus Saccharibacteria bacterium]|nr:Alkyl hydroperoxide reductase subunit C-like protein [Candidatus Saccharibacteria bacterium]